MRTLMGLAALVVLSGCPEQPETWAQAYAVTSTETDPASDAPDVACYGNWYAVQALLGAETATVTGADVTWTGTEGVVTYPATFTESGFTMAIPGTAMGTAEGEPGARFRAQFLFLFPCPDRDPRRLAFDLVAEVDQ